MPRKDRSTEISKQPSSLTSKYVNRVHQQMDQHSGNSSKASSPKAEPVGEPDGVNSLDRKAVVLGGKSGAVRPKEVEQVSKFLGSESPLDEENHKQKAMDFSVSSVLENFGNTVRSVLQNKSGSANIAVWFATAFAILAALVCLQFL